MSSRRELLQRALWIAGGAATLASGASQAATPPLLSEDDPVAKALAYHASAKKVDKSKFPTYADNQNCANCALITFGTAIRRPCSLFPGKLVLAGGWCKSWVKKG